LFEILLVWIEGLAVLAYVIVSIFVMSFFCRYVKLYGMKFSKEDHLTFIHLMYQLVTIPNLEPWLVSKFSQTLIILLK
jgi:hypothetical protein